MDRLEYTTARRTLPEFVTQLNGIPGVEVLERRDGALLALIRDKWRLGTIRREHPEIVLETLVAGGAD
jgi:peptide chain release factor 3